MGPSENGTAADSSEAVVYVNGAFRPQRDAAVSVFDHGFLYGDGVFDTCCAAAGTIFMLDEHVERLYRSIKAARIEVPIAAAEMKRLIVETVRRNGLRDAYIKVVVSRGVSPEPLLDPRGCVPGVVIFARPLLNWVAPEKVERGLSARISSVRRVDHSAIDPKIKSLNYLNLALAKIDAIDNGCDEAILLDSHGYVCEGPGYNLFAAIDGVLATPSDGILIGVTRTAVMVLAERLGIPAREGRYTPYDLYTADEVFFCSTAGGIIPIARIDGRPIGAGGVGPLTRRLQGAYQALLESGEFGTPIYADAELAAAGAGGER